MAELIEYNLEDVDAAILAVRVALANGMSWEDLARMVKDEKKSGNPVAGLIEKLYLERNCMTLLLSNNLDEMEDDEKTQPVEKVLLDVPIWKLHDSDIEQQTVYAMLTVAFGNLSLCIKDQVHACSLLLTSKVVNSIFKNVLQAQGQLGEIADVSAVSSISIAFVFVVNF